MILELLGLPLARRILGAALVFAALAAIVLAIYHAGTHAGAAAADRARIAALSDSALRSDLAQRLGGVIPSGGAIGLIGPQSSNPSVSASDPSAAGKYPGEGNSLISNSLNSPAALRAIDVRLSDCEHLSEQTAALTQQVAALTERDAARDAQLTATASERDAALDAYNQLVPLYAQAFRAATQRRRRWFCLFLCATGPRLVLPPPLTLRPPLSPPPQQPHPN